MSAATSAMHIGITAYSALDRLVFLRVPNERGRWLLTEQCCAEVQCSHCGAVVGEPCHDGRRPEVRKYHVGIHYMRRNEARAQRGSYFANTGPKPKLRLRPDDIEAANGEAPAIGTETAPAGAQPVLLNEPLVMPKHNYLTAREAATALGMQWNDVHQLCRTGLLKAAKGKRAPDGRENIRAGNVWKTPCWWICVESIRAYNASRTL